LARSLLYYPGKMAKLGINNGIPTGFNPRTETQNVQDAPKKGPGLLQRLKIATGLALDPKVTANRNSRARLDKYGASPNVIATQGLGGLQRGTPGERASDQELLAILTVDNDIA